MALRNRPPYFKKEKEDERAEWWCEKSTEELSGPEGQDDFPKKAGGPPSISGCGNPRTGTVRHGPQKGLASARFWGYNRFTKRTFCQPIFGRFRVSPLLIC